MLITWKDGSTLCESLKNIKEAYLVQVNQYSISFRIDKESAFIWWVPYILRKQDIVLFKVKSNYWQRAYRFGILLPKSIADAKRIDKINGNTLWWDAISKEMTNVRIVFEEFNDPSLTCYLDT